MYGTRAALGWEQAYSEALKSLRSRRGRASPGALHHTARNVFPVVHGDDCWAALLPQDLTQVERGIMGAFDGKVNGGLAGPGDDIRILNRITPHSAWLRMGNRQTPCGGVVSLVWAALGVQELAFSGRKQMKSEAGRQDDDAIGRAAGDSRVNAARANLMLIKRLVVA